MAAKGARRKTVGNKSGIKVRKKRWQDKND
jgi:hypothetical protein